MPNLFIFDFDGCITDWNDQLSFERAQRIASLMRFFLKHGHIEVISLANHAHIDFMIAQSGSKQLSNIFANIPWSEWNTIENRQHLIEINPSRNESALQQKKMIINVMHSARWLEDPDCIHAYKKVNALFFIAEKYSIKPDHVFFFDDNIFNIIFARANGFNAFYVNNHPSMPEFNISSHLRIVKHNIQSKQKSFTISKSSKSQHTTKKKNSL